MQDLTLVIAIDGKTAPQLEASYPTWLRHYPEMWSWPWLIIYDRDFADNAKIREMVATMGLQRSTAAPWPPSGVTYDSQRHKMLASFVYLPPAYVNTSYWMKLDTDAIAVRRCPEWIDPTWFEPDEWLRRNAWIANSWSYTKAKGDDRTIEQWADALEDWGDTFSPRSERLHLDSKIRGNKILHHRMASWLSFYSTDWSYLLRGACYSFSGAGQLPVPSQDTVAWYFAERRGDRKQTVRLLGKRRGWTNVPGLSRLRERVAAVMAETP